MQVFQFGQGTRLGRIHVFTYPGEVSLGSQPETAVDSSPDPGNWTASKPILKMDDISWIKDDGAKDHRRQPARRHPSLRDPAGHFHQGRQD
jgi:hypothetical protein